MPSPEPGAAPPGAQPADAAAAEAPTRTGADASAPGDGGGPVPGPGVWLELSVSADVEAVEVVSEILGRVAPAGTSVEPAFLLTSEGLAAEIDPSRPAIVRAYLPAREPANVDAAVAQVRAALGHLQAFGLRPIGELRTRLLDEADWSTAWKSHFPVMRIGRRLVVRPTWRRHRRAEGDVVLALDPGMAFGTGLHPTTRLCLAGLEQLADEGLVAGRRVLDVGCGSGILSIAAAKLGAGSVLGVDIDPLAIEATAANARRNGVARRVAVRRGSLPTGEPPFDVVLANLIASLVIELAEPLANEIRPGGRLLASGVFENREDEVRAALLRAGCAVSGVGREEDWVVIDAVRPIRVLFLCTGNSARSQMAEALLRREGGSEFAVTSAGVEPKGVNALTVRVLAEAGIDWSGARSKSVDAFVREPFDYVITVCDRARQACPVFPGARRMLHWDIEDPAEAVGYEAARTAAFRAAREDIAGRVKAFVGDVAAEREERIG